MTTETFIYVLITNLIALTLSTMLYAARVHEVRRECVEQLRMRNQEILEMREMVRRTKMQRRVLDSTPVARLIRDDAS